MSVVKVGDVNIHYEVHGDGLPPLLFDHGLRFQLLLLVRHS